VDEVVPTLWQPGELDGLPLEPLFVVVPIADRNALPQSQQVRSVPLAVVGVERGRGLTQERRLRVGLVAVAEAESGLAVPDDPRVVTWSAELVSGEAQVMPVLVVLGDDVLERRDGAVALEGAVEALDELVGGHRLVFRLPLSVDYKRAGAAVIDGGPKRECVPPFRRTPDWCRNQIGRGCLIEVGQPRITWHFALKGAGRDGDEHDREHHGGEPEHVLSIAASHAAMLDTRPRPRG
jgi:hypothetical protein